VPLDGVIEWGEADVSAEHITGEALPARRTRGDELPAGARSLDGILAVRATRPASQSTLARIAALTRQARVRGGLFRGLFRLFKKLLSEAALSSTLLSML
jgi:Cd2+/Zn2+-exporting ATPase